MALDTKADIKTAVRKYFGRNDGDFVEQLDSFVVLAEQRIAIGGSRPMESPPIRARDMEESAEVAVTAGVGTLPADYLAERRLYWASNPIGMPDFKDAMGFWADSLANETGASMPAIWTIEGATLRVAPAASGTARLLYYKRIPALADDGATNWLLAKAPGIYLWATIIEASVFARNSERMETALAQFQTAAGALAMAENRARFGQRMAMTIPGAS